MIHWLIESLVHGGASFPPEQDWVTLTIRTQVSDGQLTTDNGRLTTDNGRLTTDNGQLTTDNGQLTTDNGRLTTDNGQPLPILHPQKIRQQLFSRLGEDGFGVKLHAFNLQLAMAEAHNKPIG